MHITSNYYRCRQHHDALELGVSEGLVHMVETAALEAEEKHDDRFENVKPLRPSRRTLRLLKRRYKNSIAKDQVA
jgi:hypothetical protein